MVQNDNTAISLLNFLWSSIKGMTIYIFSYFMSGNK